MPYPERTRGQDQEIVTIDVGTVFAGAATVLLAGKNSRRLSVVIVNEAASGSSVDIVYSNELVGGSPVGGSVPLAPGAGISIDKNNYWDGDIYAVAAGAATLKGVQVEFRS